MFKFQIERIVQIQGCPENGLEAIDFRQQNGLSAEPNNKVLIELDVTDEQLVRKCKEIGIEVDRNGDVLLRQAYSTGNWWVRRGKWSRPGHKYDSSYLLVASPELLVRVLCGDRDAFIELLDIHVNDCKRAEEAWEEAELNHVLMLRLQEEENAKTKLAMAAARELLKDELAELQELKNNRSQLSHFLANIPLDALQGTLKRMTADSQDKSVDALRDAVEEASDKWIFSNRDDEQEQEDE